jgi:uncharacterized repeat protein (TIGR01451 family)
MNVSRYLAIAACSLALGACGGGGGGGDGGGGGGAAPLSYVGNTNAAVITTTNAGPLTANVVSGGDATQAVNPTTSVAQPPLADGGMIELGRRLQRAVRASAAQRGALKSLSNPALAIAIDEPLDCESGSGRVFGTLSDSGTGTVSIQYNGCRTGTTTATGTGTMRIDALLDFGNSVILTDFTITFTRLTVTSPGSSAAVSGSLRSHLDIPARTETVTENMVALLASGVMTKSENVVYIDVYNDIFSPTSATESVSGRIFHSVYGWVDVSTPVPLRFSNLTQDFPDNGLLLLSTGTGGPRIQITALSTTLLNLALDLDGNGSFERVALLAWTDLVGPAGANLADSDSDGMHDAWESANGFDLNDPGDALADADADGASNRAEYDAGSDPRNAASMPPSVGLSIQATNDTPDPAFVGGTLTYTFTVSNSSNLPANNVVVTDTLPAGAALISASAAQGSCSGLATVTCALGTVNGFTGLTVTIVVSPTATGTLNNTATVATSSFDPLAADNSATSVTLVGLPGAGIQGRIDIASPGDTITVDPGTYTGPLNFGHKNVTLRSRDGAAVTIINGGAGQPVISIGNGGGALIGFTITGGQGTFGAGVHLGASTAVLIADNIFEGNQQGAGGYGAAIGGNAVASAVIERNVFRNNGCDGQFLSGVVSFINASSPRIVNNVFHSNPCRGVNLDAVNGPHEVVNNTFVGNRTGVRLGRFVDSSKIYRNNILVGNDIGVEIDNGLAIPMPVVWTHNLVFGNTSNYPTVVGDQTGMNGNISANPQFVDAPAGNYDLVAASPAIGAGTSDNAPATDFDGVLRGPAVDIGAFEGP